MKMRKTSTKLCHSCKYSKFFNGDKYYCDYLSMTYKRRNCKVGYCDKYERRVEECNNDGL